jgi:hypothetical protein
MQNGHARTYLESYPKQGVLPNNLFELFKPMRSRIEDCSKAHTVTSSSSRIAQIF